MKRLFFFLFALLCLGSATLVQADYYVAGTMNGWSANSNDWKMSGSGPYSVTKQLASGSYEFKVTNGSWSQSWADYDNTQSSNVILSTSNGNISFALSTTSDVTFYFDATSSKAYVQAEAADVPSYTFTSGTTIYYDFREYGKGVNLFNSVWNNEWKSDVSSIISVTLTSDWEVTTSSSLFKSEASGWSIVTCSTLPDDGHNMLVSTDGVTYTWGTYSGGEPEPDPTPATIKLHGNFTGSWANTDAFVIADGNATASLTLEDVTAGTYEFGVRVGTDNNWTSNGASFARADDGVAKEIVSGSGNCTFVADVDGDYTFTWTYDDNTLTITYPEAPPVTYYLAGSFNSWNTTADPFVKATEDATTASVSINITEYSNITFKVMEGASYCGADDAAIDKDHTSVTIAAATEGDNIAMTPYAAGDYIFTLDLESRELTVTYPDGEAMPVPTNIFLACEASSWEKNNDYKFTVDGDEATLTKTLDANADIQFKLIYNDAWMSANYNFNYYWNSDVAFSSSESNNAHLLTFKAGTYTFRFDLTNNQLSIDFQATTATDITISSYGYATLFSDKGFDVPEAVKASIVSGQENGKLVLTRIYRIPANTGVLLEATPGTYAFYEGDSRYMGVDVDDNKFKGSLTNATVDNDKVHYVLSYNTEDQVGFFWPYGTGANKGVGSFENKAGKAYLEFDAQDQPAPVVARRGYMLTTQTEVVTAAENTEAVSTRTAKLIRDGQLLIIRDNQIFNAQGVRVQ